ncbi:hypothetical protein JZY91_10920 [Corynebacterium sp. CNCTC7651]|nr:hypothetical protein JZY91_10920 [Corynebacterium sp. CNCTC7651]
MPLRAGALDCIHPRTAAGVFWELDPLAAGVDAANPEIDKEAWMVAMAYRQDPIGFSIVDCDVCEPATAALATILFCPAEDAPGAVRMPTAPVSRDAWLITSLHIDVAVRRRGWESVLLDSVIGAATAAGIEALEVFGVRGDASGSATSPACRDLIEQAPVVGLTEVSILESAGFKVHVDHPAIPRLRLTLPPQFDLLTAHEIAELLAEIPAR